MFFLISPVAKKATLLLAHIFTHTGWIINMISYGGINIKTLNVSAMIRLYRKVGLDSCIFLLNFRRKMQWNFESVFQRL